MLKLRQKRLAHRSKEALRGLVDVEISITKLTDDDLLDLADIFKAEPRGILGGMAWAEMSKRNITL